MTNAAPAMAFSESAMSFSEYEMTISAPTTFILINTPDKENPDIRE